MDNEAELQRQYYSQTAAEYDDMHLLPQDEHTLALHLLAAYIEFHDIRSVLDVGAGTGRTILWLKQRYPQLIVRGVEPVSALREQAYKKGVAPEDLVDGNAYELPFDNDAFELVCEFAVLHHVKQPRRMIGEMTRVAERMLAISDCNFMGHGPLPVRLLKYGFFCSGLWSLVDRIKTRGKGFTMSVDDGLAYSYSVFQDLPLLRRLWQEVTIIAVRGHQGGRLSQLVTADQFLMLGLRKRGSSRGSECSVKSPSKDWQHP